MEEKRMKKTRGVFGALSGSLCIRIRPPACAVIVALATLIPAARAERAEVGTGHHRNSSSMSAGYGMILGEQRTPNVVSDTTEWVIADPEGRLRQKVTWNFRNPERKKDKKDEKEKKKAARKKEGD